MLFKNRGKALVREEQDRKKVNTIPRRKEELLALADHKGNLMIYDEVMSSYVEDQAQIYEELFPQVSSRVKSKQSSSLSSTKSGKSFTTPILGNKTASPRSTKKLGRYYKSPVARSSARTLRAPQSIQNSIGTNRVTDSPKAKPNTGMTRSNATLGMPKNNIERNLTSPRLFHDGTINESAFTDNVPYISTVCMNSTTTNNRTRLQVITMNAENDNTVVLTGLIDKLVAARDAAGLQERSLRQQNSAHGAVNPGLC